MNMIGKTIDGRYEILEEIGKGGMARVYKSRDKALNRLVAVKVLKEDYKDDREFVRRFNIEAQAAASLSNPHIVSIYDVGCEDGVHYIVMEYVEGETLKEYIDRNGALPWREAAEYSIQVCEGIEEAHRNSVIHRDIKPQNIIMEQGGVLKVTDFGIARASTQATLTMASNNTIGTAHYLSPEQARGGYTDERTDIYSMGVCMYEMLTGELPFDDNSAVAIAIKHLQENPKPITEINHDVPVSLEGIVSKAMAKEQDARYSSISDMIRDIRAVLVNPNVNLFGEKKKRTLDIDTPVSTTNTVKLPKLDRDNNYNNIDDTGSNDYKFNIPGSDLTDYDEQDAEFDRLNELNAKRARRQQKKKQRKIGFIAFLSGLAFLAVCFAVAFALTGGFGIFAGSSSESVRIPNIVGMTIKEAQAQYGSDFSIVEQSKTESTKPVGTILEQTPTSDTTMTKRDDIVIRVVTSSGSSSVTLSDYSGMTYDEAKDELEKLGLKYTKIEKVNNEIKEGLVFEQEPKAGSSVASGDMVTLTVSKAESTPAPTTDKSSVSSGTTSSDSSESSTNNSSGRTNSSSSSRNSYYDEDDDSSSNSSGRTSNSGSTSNSNSGTGSTYDDEESTSSGNSNNSSSSNSSSNSGGSSYESESSGAESGSSSGESSSGSSESESGGSDSGSGSSSDDGTSELTD